MSGERLQPTNSIKNIIHPKKIVKTELFYFNRFTYITSFYSTRAEKSGGRDLNFNFFLLLLLL